MKSLYLATVSCVVFPIAATAMTCDVTPDCTALGFKVPAADVKTKCNGQSRMKCPFGDFYFCSEKKCEESDYPYTAANCAYTLAGSTCSDGDGTHYKECQQLCNTSTYPYTSSNCSGTLSGSTCSDSKGKHYSSCTCTYEYDEKNCTDPYELKGYSCQDANGKTKYSDCRCSFAIGYENYGCGGTLGGRKCGSIYESCTCSSSYKYTKDNCSGTINGSVCPALGRKIGFSEHSGPVYATECCTSGCCVGYFYYSDDTCGSASTKSGTETLGVVVTTGKVLSLKTSAVSNISSVEDFTLACSVYNKGGKTWFAPTIADLQSINIGVLNADKNDYNNIDRGTSLLSSTGTSGQIYYYTNATLDYSATYGGKAYYEGKVNTVSLPVKTGSLNSNYDLYSACMFKF